MDGSHKGKQDSGHIKLTLYNTQEGERSHFLQTLPLPISQLTPVALFGLTYDDSDLDGFCALSSWDIRRALDMQPVRGRNSKSVKPRTILILTGIEGHGVHPLSWFRRRLSASHLQGRDKRKSVARPSLNAACTE